MAYKNKDLMTADIKYSIIIPHYDIPLLLGRLLNTIPEREDIQVIVVDDCSPECDKYFGKYAFLNRNNIEFYITDKNGGGGYARNEGLKHAKGKWLLFADADDLFVDGFCDVLDEHYCDGEDIIFFQIRSVFSDDLLKESNRSTIWNNHCLEYLQTRDDKYLRYRLTEPWSKMIRRDIVMENDVWFDETKVANDWLFSMKAGYYAHEVKLTPDYIYILTQREHSVSSAGWADSIDNLKVRLDVAIRVQFFLSKKEIDMKPMPIRGLMVLALKNYPSVFLSTLYKLKNQNISIFSLFWQMLFYAFKDRIGK